MTFPVVWLSPSDDPHAGYRACWDQGWVDETLTALGGDHVVGFDALPEDERGAVVVCPARYYTQRRTWLQNQLANLEWTVLILSSDEESLFPAQSVGHPQMRRWVMTPKPAKHTPGVSRHIGHGYPPDTTRLLGERTRPDQARRLDWVFAGQVNHARREQAVAAMRSMDGGEVHVSPGFTQGLDRGDYLALLADAKVVPCPSGPATPDSFRMWEALEAGCAVVADSACNVYRGGYWPLLLGGPAPFPVVDRWDDLPGHVARLVGEWPTSGNRQWAWWQAYKRERRRLLAADIRAVSAARDVAVCWPARRGASPVDEAVTVLIPTSPIESHPDTKIIDDTVASVRHWLPDAEILVMADGVRPEQEHRRADYEDYQRRLLWLAQHEWGNATVVRHEDHQHQANMTRHALTLVDTPLILFVEHDTPIVTDEPIDWPALTKPLLAGSLDMIRLHHEALILEVHQHLMVDQDVPAVVDGCPVWRTSQFSARPHLARSDYYRALIGRHFPTTGRTMIEDVAHSVAQSGSWQRHRIAVYAPAETPNNIKRSLHSDGRGDTPKYEMRFR